MKSNWQVARIFRVDGDIVGKALTYKTTINRLRSLIFTSCMCSWCI